MGDAGGSGTRVSTGLSGWNPLRDVSSTLATATNIPSSFTTPDINYAFMKGWKPSGNQYQDFLDLTSTYGIPSDWVVANYGNINDLYSAYKTANPTTTTAGPLDAVINNPTAYSPTSTSKTGVSDSVAKALEGYMKKAGASLDNYNSLISKAMSPESFIQAYSPSYDALVQQTINGLNNRGIVNSRVASDALAKSSDELTTSYWKNLLSLLSTLQGTASLPISAADALKTSTSTTTNPLAGYQLIYDILQGT